QEYEDAIRAFQRALQLDPHSEQSQRRLGLCHYTAGDASEAAKAFLEADRMAPGDPFTERYLTLLGQKPAADERRPRRKAAR
ncbi:MAG: tetratricopeptide repeat protein, partial [Gemmatimonadetes bacterium]|nr:tetratricopeptide repeat protein [Gemmatimonadota bacterium]